MASTATWKQNDLEPEITTVGLLNADGSTINLTGATNVHCMIRRTGQNGAPKVDRACTVIDAANGVVSCDWVTGDLDTIGTYDQLWRILWPGSGSNRYQSVPTPGYNTVVVEDDLTAG